MRWIANASSTLFLSLLLIQFFFLSSLFSLLFLSVCVCFFFFLCSFWYAIHSMKRKWNVFISKISTWPRSEEPNSFLISFHVALQHRTIINIRLELTFWKRIRKNPWQINRSNGWYYSVKAKTAQYQVANNIVRWLRNSHAQCISNMKMQNNGKKYTLHTFQECCWTLALWHRIDQIHEKKKKKRQKLIHHFRFRESLSFIIRYGCCTHTHRIHIKIKIITASFHHFASFFSLSHLSSALWKFR